MSLYSHMKRRSRWRQSSIRPASIISDIAENVEYRRNVDINISNNFVCVINAVILKIHCIWNHSETSHEIKTSLDIWRHFESLRLFHFLNKTFYFYPHITEDAQYFRSFLIKHFGDIALTPLSWKKCHLNNCRPIKINSHSGRQSLDP